MRVLVLNALDSCRRAAAPAAIRSKLALALVGAMAGAVASGASPAGSQDRPLVIARSMDINSLDPHRAFCDTCQIFVSSVYETLVGLGPDNKSIVPGIAESWEIADDQTVFTFHLNPKAVFADGSPVEAADVKWSLERLKHIKASPSFFVEGVSDIGVPDARTVVITMAKSNSEFINILTAPYTGVVNSDMAMQIGATSAGDAAEKDGAENWFLTHSAGSGPYVLGGYRPDEELRLKRNESYWKGPTAVGEVVFRQTKDAVAQAQLLESGAADIAMQLDAQTAQTLTDPGIVVHSIPSYNFIYVGFGAGAPSPVKLTPKVRAALAYALDYEGLIDFTVGEGNGKPQAAPIPNGFPGTADLPLPTRDLAKARALLAEEGHADGFELEARFPNLNIYGVDVSLMMQKVQQDLAEVSVKLNLQPLSFPVWLQQIRGEGIPMTAAYYAPDYYGSAQYVQYFGMIDGSPWAGRAGAKVDPSIINKREEKLLADAFSASADAQEKLYDEIGTEMIRDRIIIPIVSPNLIYAHHASVEGMRYSACCNLPLGEISRK